MSFVPTTTISIYRGTGLNFAADEIELVDDTTLVRSGVPASVLEQRRLVTNPVDGMPRTVRFSTARVFSDVDVRKGDILLDERTSQRWKAESAHLNSSPIHSPDLPIEISRVN